MSPSGSHVHSESAREREFYRYFQLADFPGMPRASEQNLPSSNQKYGSSAALPYAVTPTIPRSSDDRALTAFAQLGALRLNARRCMISFFDRRNTYLLAEATRTLSLETDTSEHDEDELWWGTRIFPKGAGICDYTVRLPAVYEDPLEEQCNLDGRRSESGSHQSSTGPRREVTIFVVPDLRHDERFRHKSFVTGRPHARFYAGVPIRSPAGHSIGSYCVLDDQSRPQGVSKEERDFMVDMAVTVMKHLEMTKAKDELRRGGMMVKGLGSFVEGRESIGDWWVSSGSEGFPEATPTTREYVEGVINMSPGSQPATARRFELKRNPLSFEGQKELGAITNGTKDFMESHITELAEPHTPDQEAEALTSPAADYADAISAEPQSLSKVATELQEVILAPDVKSTFNRAANIIREATEVDGAVFFDASIGTFGGLLDEVEPGVIEHSATQFLIGDHSDSSSSDSRRHSAVFASSPPGLRADGNHDEKDCCILGCSLSPESSHQGADIKITEGFLHELLQRYPRGRIFTFDDTCHLPNQFAERLFSPSSAPVSPNLCTVQEDAKTLHSIFRDAHALALCPLWDSHRMRWFAGAIIWTSDPMRIFTSDTELSYLAAFGNNVMAEVARLDAKMADRAKGDFISSISHELRSPLHGILGSVELLKDMHLGRNEGALVGTVEMCGRTLLDTIEHVLDFAKINNLTRTPPKDIKHGSGSSRDRASTDEDEHRKQGNSLMGLISVLDLSLLVEEVVETVYAGYGFKKLPQIKLGHESPLQNAGNDLPWSMSLDSSSGLVVIVDIQHSDNWVFKTQAGAWRRVLMNLFGNALKYTDHGYVRVRLHTRPLCGNEDVENSSSSPVTISDKHFPSPFTSRTSSFNTLNSFADSATVASLVSEVCLTVTDSGRGMSHSYQRERLFHAFAQEDPLAPGTGLGLSITKQLVQDLGGRIEIASEQGKGTEITVICRVNHGAVESAAGDDEDASVNMLEISERTRGAPVCLVGFDRTSENVPPSTPTRDTFTIPHQQTSTPTKTSYASILKGSLRRTLTRWLGMTVVQSSGRNEELPPSSFFIVSQDAIDRMETIPKSSSTIVVCQSGNRTRIARTIDAIGHDRLIEIVVQPCGPRKLAAAVAACLDRRATHRPALLEKCGLELNGADRCHSVDSGLAVMPERLRARNTRSSPLSPTRGSRTDLKKEAMSVSVEEVGSPQEEKSLDLERKVGSGAVLCVDDNPVNLNLLVAYMKKTGREHLTATNGMDAVEAYKRADGNVEYVLMDISMPVLDGLAATRQIRAWERERGIAPATVIALTGLASASAQQEALASGVDRFLTKPVKFAELGKLLISQT